MRYTAANCNRLLRIQANSLLGQPFISVCQMMDRDYWCEPLNDAGVEPEGARYISNVVVRYRTFGRTFTFVPKFYHVGRQLACPRLHANPAASGKEANPAGAGESSWAGGSLGRGKCF